MGLRRRIKLLLHSPPSGIGSSGRDSLILRPRRIGGAGRIEIGSGVTIDRHAWIAAYETYQEFHCHPIIRIGDGVTAGRHLFLTAIDRVEIGADCLLSEQIYISDHFHGTDPAKGPPVRQPLESKGPVVIGEGTFLGVRVCVLPGVTLGRHCVVGANTVVTRSFPDYSMIAGSPGRLIKRYSLERGRWETADLKGLGDSNVVCNAERPVSGSRTA